MEVDTKQQIEAIITDMIASGEKINVSRVAAKAGVSNALIYNRYPELKVRIQTAKEKQQNKVQQIETTTELEKVKSKFDKAKQKQQDAESLIESYKRQNDELWEHIQQVYSMYDQVLAERNDFAERLKFLE
jgi:DNA invertase Pin-like site-specific DNA recombinase